MPDEVRPGAPIERSTFAYYEASGLDDDPPPFGELGRICWASMSQPHRTSQIHRHVVVHGHGESSAPYAALLVVVALILVILAVRGLSKKRTRARSDEANKQDAIVAEWLYRIDRGLLPGIQPLGIVPLPGELFFYQQRAQYGQTYSQRVYAGGNRALYIPLGHGFRARVGGNQARSQTVSNFMWGAYGSVWVSNIRIVFKGDGSPEIAMAPYDRILGYEVHEDGLAIQTEGVGMMQFRTGDVILGTLFQKVIQERTKQPNSAATTDNAKGEIAANDDI